MARLLDFTPSAGRFYCAHCLGAPARPSWPEARVVVDHLRVVHGMLEDEAEEGRDWLSGSDLLEQRAVKSRADEAEAARFSAYLAALGSSDDLVLDLG